MDPMKIRNSVPLNPANISGLHVLGSSSVS
jgi:hypothetical protein